MNELNQRKGFNVAGGTAGSLHLLPERAGEIHVAEPDHRGRGHLPQPHRFHKPVAHCPHHPFGLVAMGLDVHPRQIREGPPEVVGCGFQDQAAFLPESLKAKEPGAMVDTELEAHVQPVELPGGLGTQTGEIVDAPLGVGDQFPQLLQPALPRVGSLPGDPWGVAQINDREQHRPQLRQIGRIKGAVDEDIRGEGLAAHAPAASFTRPGRSAKESLRSTVPSRLCT